jgi:hypothetical protein
MICGDHFLLSRNLSLTVSNDFAYLCDTLLVCPQLVPRHLSSLNWPDM